MIEGGSTSYVLPAPAGRYVLGDRCIVQRKACATDAAFVVVDPACPANLVLCEEIADPSVGCGVGTAATAPDGSSCTQALESQRCDWRRAPQLLGEYAAALEGTVMELDYPHPCAAGNPHP